MGADDVVVVDQWALVRLGITAVVQAAGMRVAAEEAAGRDGLLRARVLEPGLLVVGAMADLTPAEAVAQARQLPVRPRVLVLLSAAAAADVRELLQAGPDGVLVRSAGAEELRDALDRIRAGERVMTPGLMPAVMDAMQAGEGEPGPLTTKEQEVLARLAEGRSNQQIAEVLFVTPATVKTHLSHIYAKLGAANRREALARAVALGILR